MTSRAELPTGLENTYFDFEQTIRLLSDSLDIFEIQSAATRDDVRRIRAALDDACLYQPSRRKIKTQPADGGQIIEHAHHQGSTKDTRVAVQTTRRWDSSATRQTQKLKEFRAKIIHLASVGGSQAAITAEVCRLATPVGVLTLPPTITFSAVLLPDAKLFRLIDHDDTRGVQKLLRSGQASIRECDSFGMNVLHRAAWNCSADLWAMLISEGADLDGITALSTSALLLCSGLDYHRKLQVALEAGADPSLLPSGQFHIAAMDADAVRSILRISAPFIDLKLRNPQGRTLLLAVAASTQNVDQALILRLLIRAGASVVDVDPNGNACLHLLLSALKPQQPQCIEALTVLLKAGASLVQRNQDGHSPVDLASYESQEYGSFCRDALLQACRGSGYELVDQRLLAEPVFAPAYRSLDSAGTTKEQKASSGLRQRLLQKLIGEVDCSSTFARYQLHETAVDRTLSAYAHSPSVNVNQLFSAALHYLLSMTEGLRQMVFLDKDRLPYQDWLKYTRGLNWFQVREQAEMTALLEFDWLRPVDYEDLFMSFIENITLLIEEAKARDGLGSHIDRLTEVLEGALPSRKEMLARQYGPEPVVFAQERSDAQSLPRLVTVEEMDETEGRPLERRDSLSPDKKLRHCSMVKTPIQFYGPSATADEDGILSAEQADDAVMCLAAGMTAKTGRKSRLKS